MEVITRETNHYSTGSRNPEKPDGLTRIYSMKFCPFAERARLILLVKKLQHEIINIDLKKKPEWFLELNPQGKVPALDINNQILVESLDICDYLDEKYPEPKLYPADANAKKRHKELIEYFDNVIAAYYVVVRNPDDTPFPEYADKFIHMLQEYENELKGDFFGGNEPGMLDYMVWPWGERAGVLDKLRDEKFPIPEGKLTKIRAWCSRMRNLDIIKNTVISTETAYKLVQLYQAGGDVDYNSVQ